jgi:hypothetical protein
MTRIKLHWIAILAVIFCATALVARAQEDGKSPDEGKPTEHHVSAKPGLPGGTEPPMKPYRAEFAISELQDGKKINSRHYSMLLNVGSWNQLKIGTKIPVATGQGMYQYMDVGTSINCRLTESGSDVAIDVHSDFSNLSNPEEARSPTQPVIRQINISGNTVVTTGKPVLIGAVDDPSSTRQFQLETTVTKLR